MGKFTYENSSRVEIDDRQLAHLQIVFENKLRRREGFFFTWKNDQSIESGRRSVWVSPFAALEFTYHGVRLPAVNRAWLEALMLTANSPTGLYLVPEPAEQSAVRREDLLAPADDIEPYEGGPDGRGQR